MHTIALENADQPEVIALIGELDDYQATLYPPEACYRLDIRTLALPHVLFAVARDAAGAAQGCGAIVLDEATATGEVKRMYLRPAARGQGLADRLLQLLQQQAQQRGCRLLQLETGPYQAEALAFYQRAGFTRCGAYGDYPDHPLSVFMHKALG
jgi:putative acetyltransferase